MYQAGLSTTSKKNANSSYAITRMAVLLARYAKSKMQMISGMSLCIYRHMMSTTNMHINSSTQLSNV
jgi:hypothetical protein